MKTNDGVEIENNSSVWVPYPSGDSTYCPLSTNMYSLQAHFKKWYYHEVNCQKECDILNSKPAGDNSFPGNPPIEKTGVKYYVDTQKQTVIRKSTDGQIEDLTNPHIKE